MWMVKRNPNATQEQPAASEALRGTEVNGVANDAMAHGMEVATNLVGSSRVQGDLQECRLATNGPCSLGQMQAS